MSASWDPPGVTHDLIEYLKAESIREESVWGGVRNRSEAQNGVSEPPTHLLIRCQQVILTATCLACMVRGRLRLPVSGVVRHTTFSCSAGGHYGTVLAAAGL